MTEEDVSQLYQQLLQCWNDNNAEGYAALFAENGSIVGFDGTPVNGRNSISDHLSGIFTHHKVASYVSIVREIRFLTPDVAMLRGVAGMVPPGKTTINPATNAIQTMIVNKRNDAFEIAMFQNTPAAFHGRPEASDELTKELSAVLNKKPVNSLQNH